MSAQADFVHAQGRLVWGHERQLRSGLKIDNSAQSK